MFSMIITGEVPIGPRHISEVQKLNSINFYGTVLKVGLFRNPTNPTMKEKK
jgi:hypothetical protein